ncbi:hypothetical protein [Dysgonomonas gadei]|uniref:FAS1 domain-containing protein n=1 Tax=Dysgonomonas gadei ATCC BAA-286 TaxID=742766 RepID=F5ITQ2_9BACT|nr:hypothetical protein [Dysgonomonas gadei]EGJ99436.1 hypothetical protein HMPREF9455_00469 [Dysgonomonas gadei ATCC BAA-286]
MKKLFYLSFVAAALLFTSVACSNDDDPTPPPAKTQLEEVLGKLGEMENVGDFTNILKGVKSEDLGTEALTVFAVADQTQEPAPESAKAPKEGEEGEGGDDTDVTAENITRHIVKGTFDFPAEEGDEVIIESVKGDPLRIAKKDGKIWVNDVEVTSASATDAGLSKIYVVASVIPVVDIPKFTANFVVYAANEEWAEGAAEKAVTEGAKITFFELKGEEYVKVDSVATDAEGKAAFDHFNSEGLFYNVEQEGKTSFRDGYMVVGLFTTQEQIDEAPEYKTETALDKLGLGSLRIADMDGDGVIDEKDKVASGYLPVDNAAESTDLFIVSDTYKAGEAEE